MTDDETTMTNFLCKQSPFSHRWFLMVFFFGVLIVCGFSLSVFGQQAPGVEKAIKALADPERRDWARDYLRDLDEKAFDSLKRHLAENPDPDIRQGCAFVLGKLRKKQTIGVLKKALKDKAPQVRRQVAMAFAELADPSTKPFLLEALEDPKPQVQAAVIWALSEIVQPDMLNRMVRFLVHSDTEVRTNAVVAIDRIGGASTAGVLAFVALNDNDPQVSTLALSALEKLEGVAGLEVLLVVLLDDPRLQVRIAAVRGLKNLSGKSFKFKPRDPLDLRKAAIDKWKAWLKQYKKKHPGRIKPISPRGFIMGEIIPQELPSRPGFAPAKEFYPQLKPIFVRKLPDAQKHSDQLVKLFDQAMKLIEKGDPDSARRKLEDCLEINNKLWVVHNNLALVYFKMKKNRLAQGHLDFAAQLAKDSPQVTVNKAFFLAGQINMAKVEPLLKASYRKNPDQLLIGRALASFMWNHSKKDGAAQLFMDMAKKHGSNDPQLYMDAARALFETHGYKNAIENLNCFGKQTKWKQIDTNFFLAECYFRLGQFAKAEEQLLAASFRAKGTQAVQAKGFLAFYYLHRKAFDQCAKFSRTLLKSDPPPAAAWWLLAYLHMVPGSPLEPDPEIALALAEKAVAQAPDSPQAYGVFLLAGVVADQKKDYGRLVAGALKKWPTDGFITAVAEAILPKDH